MEDSIDDIINYIENKMRQDFDRFTDRCIYGKDFETYQEERCKEELSYIQFLRQLKTN